MPNPNPLEQKEEFPLNITEQMPEMGYLNSPGGVCRGLAMMAERARRYGEYAKFKERNEYLKTLKRGELKIGVRNAQNRKRKIDQVQRKNSKKKDKTKGDTRLPPPLTQEEEILLSIEPFFFQVAAYFQPKDIEKFLGASGSSLTQLDFEKLETLMYGSVEEGNEKEEGTLRLSAPHKYFLSTVLPDSDYFYEFLQKIKQSPVSTGLLIQSPDHVVHLFYDSEQQKWFFTNHSTLSEFTDERALVESLIGSFTTNGVAHLSIDVFADGEDSENKKTLVSDLKKISKESLDSLSHRNQLFAKSSKGTTSLQVAAQNNHVDAVRLLLQQPDNSAALNEGDHSDVTALYHAACFGHLNIVNMLLEHNGIDINKPNRYGSSPLFVAAYKGHAEIVKAFWKKDPSLLNKSDEKNPTPLWEAAMREGHWHVVDVMWTALKEKAADPANQSVLLNALKTQFISLLDAKRNGKPTSSFDQHQKIFFTELFVLLVEDRLTLDSLMDKLVLYEPRDLFNKSGFFRSRSKSESTKLVSSLFSALGYPLADHTLENIVHSRTSKIRDTLKKQALDHMLSAWEKNPQSVAYNRLAHEIRNAFGLTQYETPLTDAQPKELMLKLIEVQEKYPTFSPNVINEMNVKFAQDVFYQEEVKKFIAADFKKEKDYSERALQIVFLNLNSQLAINAMLDPNQKIDFFNLNKATQATVLKALQNEVQTNGAQAEQAKARLEKTNEAAVAKQPVAKAVNQKIIAYLKTGPSGYKREFFDNVKSEIDKNQMTIGRLALLLKHADRKQLFSRRLGGAHSSKAIKCIVEIYEKTTGEKVSKEELKKLIKEGALPERFHAQAVVSSQNLKHAEQPRAAMAGSQRSAAPASKNHGSPSGVQPA